jgi:subtilase family serine protease
LRTVSGPAREDIHTVSTWLELHGFNVNVVYPANGVIDFSGPAGAIRDAFHTTIETIEGNGVRHIANIHDPQIPAALAPAVDGVISMNDFRPHANVLARKQFSTANPEFPFAVVPGDLATIYDINPVYKAGIIGKIGRLWWLRTVTFFPQRTGLCSVAPSASNPDFPSLRPDPSAAIQQFPAWPYLYRSRRERR